MLTVRQVSRYAVGLAVLLFLSYVVDWAVWRVRLARGGGMGSVEVFRMTTVGLKGNKEALYPDGSTTLDCSKSIYPQAGGGACWWLQRHREIVVHH